MPSTAFITRAALLCTLWLLCFSGSDSPKDFSLFVGDFIRGYQGLEIPDIRYDYHEYFTAIPSADNLRRQEGFFRKEREALRLYASSNLSKDERILYDHLQYEIAFNLQRLALEQEWVANGRKIPDNGLFVLRNHKEWYSYFTTKFTSLKLTPEAIMALGQREVQRVQAEIRTIQQSTDYKDSAAFYQHLQEDSFYFRDKDQIVAAFHTTDSIIREHLPAFIGKVEVPEVSAMEWTNADANTPPGMYLNHSNNAYGKDVFQYNFYGGKYNRRAIEWLYMHEAIPGHHLQFSLRMEGSANPLQDSLREMFSYPGNFEGWACYVEYEGKKLGVYQDEYSYVGKWEWDLVRSARVVIDVGIHYYGWTRAQALAYWHKNVPGQDNIAEREVTRITNWAAQVLSYKLGAHCILQLKEQVIKKEGKSFSEAAFHRAYLRFGMTPLEVLKKHYHEMYERK